MYMRKPYTQRSKAGLAWWGLKVLSFALTVIVDMVLMVILFRATGNFEQGADQGLDQLIANANLIALAVGIAFLFLFTQKIISYFMNMVLDYMPGTVDVIPHNRPLWDMESFYFNLIPLLVWRVVFPYWAVYVLGTGPILTVFAMGVTLIGFGHFFKRVTVCSFEQEPKSSIVIVAIATGITTSAFIYVAQQNIRVALVAIAIYLFYVLVIWIFRGGNIRISKRPTNLGNAYLVETG